MARVSDPFKEPSRFLTAAYMVALFLIALLATISHEIISHALENQRESAEIVYLAGRQRTVAQKIVLYTFSYSESGDKKDKELLADAIFNFETGHHYLTRIATPNGGDAIRPMAPEIYDIYFKPPYNLDKVVINYIRSAKVFIGYRKVDPITIRDDAFKGVTSIGMGVLSNGLDRLDHAYQEEIIGKINHLTSVQFAITGFILCVLLIEAIFIFRPLVNHVREYSRMLLRLALKDPLTGLNNRRAFLELMEAELSRGNRHGFPFCVVMADIDKFKNINDSYGHPVGDRVIRHFANILKKAMRNEDIVGRMGGEEFAILLPNTEADQGFAVVERIRELVEKSPCVYDKDPETGTSRSLKYTSSFGISVSIAPGKPITELLSNADKALYEAKHAGRNRVVMRENYEEGDAAGGADKVENPPADGDV